MNDILADIDAAIALHCGYCDRPLAADGPSMYYCSEACQGRSLAPSPHPPGYLAMSEVLRQELHLGTADQPLYAVLPETDTRAALTYALQTTGHQVLAADTDVSADAFYRVEVSHCIITGDGPPATCDCGRGTYFIDAGDYGFGLPAQTDPLRLARVIRAINLYPDTVYRIFQQH